MNMLNISLGAIEIAYYDVGPRDAEDVIVLLHDGAYGSSAKLAWEQMMPELAGSFRVIAPDLVGYGSSSKVTFFDRPPQAAHGDVIAAFLAKVGIEAPRVHAVGSSFGGSAAVTAARMQFGRPVDLGRLDRRIPGLWPERRCLRRAAALRPVHGGRPSDHWPAGRGRRPVGGPREGASCQRPAARSLGGLVGG